MLKIYQKSPKRWLMFSDLQHQQRRRVVDQLLSRCRRPHHGQEEGTAEGHRKARQQSQGEGWTGKAFLSVIVSFSNLYRKITALFDCRQCMGMSILHLSVCLSICLPMLSVLVFEKQQNIELGQKQMSLTSWKHDIKFFSPIFFLQLQQNEQLLDYLVPVP